MSSKRTSTNWKKVDSILQFLSSDIFSKISINTLLIVVFYIIIKKIKDKFKIKGLAKIVHKIFVNSTLIHTEKGSSITYKNYKKI